MRTAIVETSASLVKSQWRAVTAWAEFHALGFDEVIPVSAEHKRGLVDLSIAIAVSECQGNLVHEVHAKDPVMPGLVPEVIDIGLSCCPLAA